MLLYIATTVSASDFITDLLDKKTLIYDIIYNEAEFQMLLQQLSENHLITKSEVEAFTSKWIKIHPQSLLFHFPAVPPSEEDSFFNITMFLEDPEFEKISLTDFNPPLSALPLLTTMTEETSDNSLKRPDTEGAKSAPKRARVDSIPLEP